MKDTTRYAVLLFGVLTLLTSSYMVINLADSPSDAEVNGEPPENINETVNGEEISQNETETLPPSERPEPDTLIGKSIRGFQIMFEDIGKGLEIISDTGD